MPALNGNSQYCHCVDRADSDNLIVPGSVTCVTLNMAHLDANATGVAFYGATPAAKQTGVAVTAEAIHAALVALGLIAA